MSTGVKLKDLFSHIRNTKHPYSNILNTRLIVITITLFFSIATYYYLVDFYATDFSIFSYLPFRTLPSYTFYSGNPKLTYNRVGRYLTDRFNNKVTNEGTNGGVDNARRVLTSPLPSFGLVQEDVLKADDFMKTQLNFVAPIYLERMHIIYNQKAYEDSRDTYKKALQNPQTGSKDALPPQISSYTEPEILDFFASAEINIAPVGSGTNVIASYILEAINEQIHAREAERINTNLATSVGQIRRELGKGNHPTHGNANSMLEGQQNQNEINKAKMHIHPTSSGDALDCLKAQLDNTGPYPCNAPSCNGVIPNIVFVVAGSPNEAINEIIRSDKFGLVSIDSTFINNLNLKHGTNFRATGFCDNSYCKYGDKYGQVATLGTYAYLVTDQRTPTIDILKILDQLNVLKDLARIEEVLKNSKDKDDVLVHIQEVLKNSKDSSKDYELARILRDDFDFLAYYNKQSQSRFMLSLRNLLVFLVTLGMAFTPSFIFLSWFVSGIQQMKYLAKLSKVIEENIPINEEIDSSISGKVTGEAATSNGNNEKDHDVESKGDDGSAGPGGAKVTGEAATSNGNNEKDYDVESKGDDGSAGAGDGVVMSGIDNRKNPLSRSWIDSSIQLVREFIRSGKVMSEGTLSNDNNEKDLDVESKGDDGSVDHGGAHYRNYLLPTIDDDQTPIINKIISGQNELNKLRKEIGKDTGVNDTHTTFLIGRIDQIVDKLRKSLGIRLNCIIERHDQEVDEMLLLKYLTADWITKDDYEWLVAKLRNRQILAGGFGSRRNGEALPVIND
jgi:TRAP-type uncharacterized transport system substrate-binding protein